MAAKHGRVCVRGLLAVKFTFPYALFHLFMILFISSVGVTRYSSRRAWDTLMFHAVIKPRGRVPACDSIAVRRIAGPGLAQDYCYLIRPEQALASLEAKMELDELAAFQQQVEQVILQPQRDFRYVILPVNLA